MLRLCNQLLIPQALIQLRLLIGQNLFDVQLLAQL